MTTEVDSLRPNGIKRKLLRTPIFDYTTAGDYHIGYFPHGAKLLGMWSVTTTAITVADETIDIGIAKDGDTVIDGLALAYSGSAIGDAVDIFQTKGTNGGVTQIAVGGSLWLQTSGASTAGQGYIVVEYEDNNN